MEACMITAGTRQLKNNLSHYLRSVGRGEEVIVTVHGKPWARIVPEPRRDAVLDRRLRELAAKGLIRLPTGSRRKVFPPPIRAKGKPLSQIIIEDRR
jgi:prevent-host-death family protein